MQQQPMQPEVLPGNANRPTARRSSSPRRPGGRDHAHNRPPVRSQIQGENEYTRPWAIVYIVTLAILSIPTVVLPVVTAVVAATIAF